VWRWLRLATEPQHFSPAGPTRRSFAGRVRTLFRSSATANADG
jgi:hypothetical protein